MPSGPWHSVFVTPDPEGTYTLSQARREELEELLDCRRLAGREVHVLDPRYRPVDVEITVCVEAGHIPSEVRDRVLRRIRGDAERPGLYDADSLTFGTPIYRLTLEAARRVAHLLGEAVGERVGYQVRFDSKVGPKTRIRFITEGLLTRRLRDDPRG